MQGTNRKKHPNSNGQTMKLTSIYSQVEEV